MENIRSFRIEETIYREPLFKENSVDELNRYILEKRPKNIIVLCGAGISTNCGIPDFRTDGIGLYAKLRDEGIPYPEAVFSLDYFRMNPKPFYKVCKELDTEKYEPGIVHKFICELDRLGILLRCYTQNIDTLERKAGLDPDKLVEAHGSFNSASCCVCHRPFDWPTIKGIIFSGDIPQCREVLPFKTTTQKHELANYCQGFIKPNVVLYGECMSKRFFECEQLDIAKCDLMLIIGTSLAVYPFAGLAEKVSKTCPRILINNKNIELFIDKEWRDMVLLGDCDTTIGQIIL